MAYATAAQFASRFDVRLIGDLAADDNTRVVSGSFAANARIVAALDDASAMMDLAFKAAQGYNATQLSALVTAQDPALIRLCCELALGFMYEARGGGMGQGHQAVVDGARDALEEIRQGKHVLNDIAAQLAGLPDIVTVTRTEAQINAQVSESDWFPQTDRTRI